MKYGNLELMDATNPESIADWLELVLAVNKPTISKPEIKSYIKKSLGKEPKDSFVDDVFLELKRRSELYGEYRPFSIQNGLINSNINWRKRPEYVLCLIFSIFGNPKRVAQKDGTLFERLSMRVIQGYLNSEVIAFNYPKRKKIKDISEVLSEKFKKELPARRKDRGIDLIAWKPFGDRRPSQLIILFQCSAGNNWDDKTLDINIAAWKRYMDFGDYVTKGFCFPKITPTEEYGEDSFGEISIDAGIIIDRIRIFRCICKIKMERSFIKELRDWCERKLKYFNQ